MEKVKLTRKQADALEKAISDYGIDTTMHDHSPNNWGGLLAPLNELKPHQMARALYIGYEVEETFEVGNWVVYDNGVERGYGYKTNQIKDVDEQKAYFDEGRRMHLTSLRHATPEEITKEKQRRWWVRHGRDVYEFKEGDLIKRGDLTSEVEEVKEKIIWIKFNKSKGTYTREYYDQIKVICFAEDRKDLEA